MLSINFERGVRLLVEYFPVSDENTRKPILFHSIRVWTYLYNRWYSENVVLAGLLHDIIENSDITEKMLEEEFWKEILRLVLASTKDMSIEKSERNKELINRCINEGQDALIIKVADILDSFMWYFQEDNKEQLFGHCLKTANLILDLKPDSFDDKIFDELKEWRDKVEDMKKEA